MSTEPKHRRRMTLKSIAEFGSFDKELVYLVEHDNGKTTAFQDLRLTMHHGGKATAKMNFADMEEMESPDAALNKLADWLERMSVAIREREVNTEYTIFK